MALNNLNFNNNYSIQQMQDILAGNRNKNVANKDNAPLGTSFEEILARQKEQTSGLKFSKHASERLIDRDIDMTDEQLERLETGAKKAGLKGINESLVMVDGMAFIVNIKNNTVITAVAGDDEMVFSNIDGAVIA
ncbi:MAG: flagellar protein [Lachnospiraceae bacterium]|nr:flagellar protein [Lachnospiraceae bacterium]